MLRADQMSMIWFQFLEAFFHDLIPTYGGLSLILFYAGLLGCESGSPIFG